MMKRTTILFVLLILGLFVASGCEFDLEKGVGSLSEEDIDKVIKCEKPYIRHASGCCLDDNNDGICDEDERHCKTIKTPYQEVETYTVNENYVVQESYQDQECVDIEVPYTVTEEKTQTLFDVQDKTLSPYERYYKQLHLDGDTLVEVSFNADDTLNLWAVNSYDWNRILQNIDTDDYLLGREGIKSATASFKTTVEDDYVIYLKNMHWFEEVSVFNFKAVAKWTETVEKTKTEEKCTTVTKYKDVTKTRPVTKKKIVTKYKTEEICN